MAERRSSTRTDASKGVSLFPSIVTSGKNNDRERGDPKVSAVGVRRGLGVGGLEIAVKTSWHYTTTTEDNLSWHYTTTYEDNLPHHVFYILQGLSLRLAVIDELKSSMAACRCCDGRRCWSSAWGRLGRLALISVLLLGSCMSYESVAVLAPYLKRERGVYGQQLGGLFAAYHAPNVLIVFMSGIIIDRVGALHMALVCSAVVLGSACVFSLSKTFSEMVLARIILGAGSEALSVAQMALTNAAFGTESNPAQSFPSLAVAYSVQLIVARLGVLALFQFLPVLVERHGWPGTWPLAGVAGVSVLAAAGLELWHFWEPSSAAGRGSRSKSRPGGPGEAPGDLGDVIEVGGEGDAAAHPLLRHRQQQQQQHQSDTEPESLLSQQPANVPLGLEHERMPSVGDTHAEERPAVSPLVHWDAVRRRVCTPAFALCVTVMLLHSACTIPYGEYSVDLYSTRFSLSSVEAARLSSYSLAVGIVVTLPLAYVADRSGQFGAIVAAGLAVTLPCFIVLAADVRAVPVAVIVCFLGLGGSAVGAALWPALSVHLPDSVAGSVLGIALAGQNAALVVGPLAVGLLRDSPVVSATPAASSPSAGILQLLPPHLSPTHARGANFGPALWFTVAGQAASLALALALAVLQFRCMSCPEFLGARPQEAEAEADEEEEEAGAASKPKWPAWPPVAVGGPGARPRAGDAGEGGA